VAFGHRCHHAVIGGKGGAWPSSSILLAVRPLPGFGLVQLFQNQTNICRAKRVENGQGITVTASRDCLAAKDFVYDLSAARRSPKPRGIVRPG